MTETKHLLLHHECAIECVVATHIVFNELALVSGDDSCRVYTLGNKCVKDVAQDRFTGNIDQDLRERKRVWTQACADACYGNYGAHELAIYDGSRPV